MLFKSQVYTQVSGSVGGVTYTHGPGGLIARARSTPVNPNTTYQQEVRSWMSALATRWQDTLTAAQRAAWEVFATNMPVINRLGEQIYISGISMYVRCNLPRLQAGLDYVDDGPTTYVQPTFTINDLTFSASADTCVVTFDNTEDWANEDDAAMLVYCSRPLAPTINYFKGPYRYADLIAGDAVTPPTSPAAITLPFPCEAGQKLFARIRVVRADGRLSPSFRDGAVAT
jgi:hypothetical protein